MSKQLATIYACKIASLYLALFATCIFQIVSIAAYPQLHSSKLQENQCVFVRSVHELKQNFFAYVQPDPTHGDQAYIEFDEAEHLGILSDTHHGNIRIGSIKGKSLRIESNHKFTTGYVVMEFQSAPWREGSWPAFWTVNELGRMDESRWPDGGEIDIWEGMPTPGHLNSHQSVFHAGSCQSSNTSLTREGLYKFLISSDQERSLQYTCDRRVQSPEGKSNEAGCGFSTDDAAVPSTRAGKFTRKVAMHWTNESIVVWYTDNSAEINDTNPELNTAESTVTLRFSEGCPSDLFYDHRLILNTAWCGDGWYIPQTCPYHASNSEQDSWEISKIVMCI